MPKSMMVGLCTVAALAAGCDTGRTSASKSPQPDSDVASVAAPASAKATLAPSPFARPALTVTLRECPKRVLLGVPVDATKTESRFLPREVLVNCTFQWSGATGLNIVQFLVSAGGIVSVDANGETSLTSIAGARSNALNTAGTNDGVSVSDLPKFGGEAYAVATSDSCIVTVPVANSEVIALSIMRPGATVRVDLIECSDALQAVLGLSSDRPARRHP